MNLLFDYHRIFISHKRENGDASSDALLIKQILDKRFLFKTFIDIHQDTTGEFPRLLKEKVMNTQTFILLIPYNGDVSFLYDSNGWVYKEVNYALNKYILSADRKDRVQILPITFSNSFEWPNDIPHGISKICDFDICKLHRNDKPSITQEKLLKAIRYNPLKCFNVKIVALLIVTLLCLIICVYKYAENKKSVREQQKRIEFVQSSWHSLYLTKPVVEIPEKERSEFEDSIYLFFELKDSLHKVIGDLPKTNFRIEADDFTRRRIVDMGEKSLDISHGLQRLSQMMFNLALSPSFNKTCYSEEEIRYLFVDFRSALKSSEKFIDYEKKTLKRLNAVVESNNLRAALSLVDNFFKRTWFYYDDRYFEFETVSKLLNKQLLTHYQSNFSDVIDDDATDNLP